jgi:predicted dienelactone hydrolase
MEDVLRHNLACVGAAVLCAASGSQPVYRLHTFSFVDRTRTIRTSTGSRVPRPLTTVVREPTSPGPHPLIVFAHGFALLPGAYERLLDAWARAGFVVAAPIFPLTNAAARGGPNESDLINQPRDVSVVISRLLMLSGRSSGVLAGAIDPGLVAVAGQSDGGVTALAVAYDSRFRDRRIRAAIVMSGARLGGMRGFPRVGPPLLALQGTADTTNAPATTAAYFAQAPRPKFLLWLLGARHLPPYTTQQPQLGLVERASIGFLDHYLLHRSLRIFEQAARATGVSRLVADP